MIIVTNIVHPLARHHDHLFHIAVDLFHPALALDLPQGDSPALGRGHHAEVDQDRPLVGLHPATDLATILDLVPVTDLFPAVLPQEEDRPDSDHRLLFRTRDLVAPMLPSLSREVLQSPQVAHREMICFPLLRHWKPRRRMVWMSIRTYTPSGNNLLSI